MKVLDILEVLRRHAYLIAALCIGTALAGYGISFITQLVPETYDAAAVVLVRPHDSIRIGQNYSNKEYLGFPVAQTPVAESASKTYIEIIKSPKIIGDVVRKLNLDQKLPEDTADSTIFARLTTSVREIYDDLRSYWENAVAVVKYGRALKDDPFNKAVATVSDNLVLKSYPDTYVFEIGYRDKIPQRAAAVANTIATTFIQFLETMRSSEATAAAGRLEGEMDQSRQRLTAAREGLRDYKAAHHVFLYGPEYDAKLRVISELTVELAKLDESLAAGSVESQNYQKKRATLLKLIDQQQAGLASLPTIERDLQLRQAAVDVANATYGTVARQLKDEEIKAEDAMPEARLVSPALAPRLPSGPRRGLIVLASLVAGMLAGVALAFLLEYVNRTVRRINEIEDFVGLKVIGTIPLLPFDPRRQQARLAASRPSQP